MYSFVSDSTPGSIVVSKVAKWVVLMAYPQRFSQFRSLESDQEFYLVESSVGVQQRWIGYDCMRILMGFTKVSKIDRLQRYQWTLSKRQNCYTGYNFFQRAKLLLCIYLGKYSVTRSVSLAIMV